jgi:hypothetical protein
VPKNEWLHSRHTFEVQQIPRGPDATSPETVALRHIPSVLVEMIAQHLAGRGLTADDPHALVFVAERGGPLNYSHWRQRIWNPACERAGLASNHRSAA